jgi:hypothetical protein
MMSGHDELVAFAERVLELLDGAQVVATYKYAVLLALMDICLEQTRPDGIPENTIKTRDLADKVIQLYWPQTLHFRGKVLRQYKGSVQAKIITDICRFRETLPDHSVALARVKSHPGFPRLLRAVEKTLVENPLPRLQYMKGESEAESLLYTLPWSVQRDHFGRLVLRRTEDKETDSIELSPGVAKHLVSLNGLLRPLIHRAWSGMVAQVNGLDDSKLERFLFGVDRSNLRRVTEPLLGLQDGECFYCHRAIKTVAHVDHFLPWSRRPDNGVHNLVVADELCNAAKRDYLAAEVHVERWRDRNYAKADALRSIANQSRWEHHPDETLGVARGLYLRLSHRARLWVESAEFRRVDQTRIQQILA